VERKLATILFIDLVESTALVSGSDPEVARRRIDDYFARATQAIVAHGGTVEKFVGDAVMAAFGAPQTHEDDAERAVRAAFEIFDALPELGLEARAGIESGEVVVGEGDSTFVTGEAVNVAARLQQSGLPGAIMLGPAARRLTEGTVEAAASGAIAVDGVRRVPSSQALRILAEPRRQADSLFVGRRYELDLLAGLYRRSQGDRRARLVTVTGEPGIGKSRLVAEFVDGLGRATVLKGRALPYGDGVGLLADRLDDQERGGDQRRRAGREDAPQAPLRLGRRDRRVARRRPRAARTSVTARRGARDCLGDRALGGAGRNRVPNGSDVRRHAVGRSGATRSDRAPRRCSPG
jgi:class 3 adenylate cyclase